MMKNIRELRRGHVFSTGAIVILKTYGPFVDTVAVQLHHDR